MQTLIKGGTVLAFENNEHVIIEDGIVVFNGNLITQIGSEYTGEADVIINASGKLVLPGFINMHMHVTDTAYTGELLVDQGHHDWRDTLYKHLPAVRGAVSAYDEFNAAECAFAELILSGTTTAVELGFDYEMMEGGDLSHTKTISNIACDMGLRLYIGPRYRTMYWGLGDDGEARYSRYPQDGLPRFDECVKFCREQNGRFNDRLRTMLAPGQVDTCDPELLEGTREVANETGIPIQLHAGQTTQEFKEIMRRYNKTTIEYIADTGLLGADLTIGHGMFLSEDGDVDNFATGDLETLRDSGASIAHLPWIQVRQGRFMRSFSKYHRAGVNMCLGTDTFPFNMINEMRWAAILSKIADQDPKVGTAREVFHAATVGGAKALNREDIGRLAPGCKADIVIMDYNTPHALPLRDPFKFLVFGASSADVETVIIDGRTVLADKELLFCNLSSVLDKLRESINQVHERVRL